MQNTLSSMSIYFISSFNIPKRVRLRLEKGLLMGRRGFGKKDAFSEMIDRLH